MPAYKVMVIVSVIGYVDYCASDPCLNEGTCISLKTGYLCECVEDDWSGRDCGKGE